MKITRRRLASLVREAIDDVLIVEAIEFEYVKASPLMYSRGGGVRRLIVIDTDVTTPAKKGDTYFAPEWKTWSSKTRKPLKKPKLVDPGIDDPRVVGFMDFHPIDSDSWYIDYMKVRMDQRGRKLARMMVEKFYADNPNMKYVNWGRMMNPSVRHLFDDMKSRHPDISHSGYDFY